MAEKAGKAAPAMAIAGALVAAPSAHAAVKTPAAATATVEHVRTDALITSSKPASRTYTVRPGDTLSSIAQRFYGNPSYWPWLFHVNRSVISDPNDLYVGEKLNVPYDPPANAASYAPKHAKSAVMSSSASPLSGTLGCSGLEALWEQAGGSPAEAFTAAEIAMAESGGDQYALSPTDDYGYWQINASHGPALATFSPDGNARAAITISDDGTDWDAWTTYVTGAYEGRC